MKSNPQEFSDKEIDARREAGLKKLLATPHKPHKTSAGPKPGAHGSDPKKKDQHNKSPKASG